MAQKANLIVLTGGPCSGKSTALPILADFLRQRDFTVYTIQELATMMFTNGIDLHHKYKTVTYELESAVMRMQLAIEDSYRQLAESDTKSVILCDRSTMDYAAYTPEPIWRRVLSDFQVTEPTLLDRYAGVIHLTTVAIGAEQFFTNENNPARQCTPELARTLDHAAKKAWSRHSKHYIIDNETDFARKLIRAQEALRLILNLDP